MDVHCHQIPTRTHRMLVTVADLNGEFSWAEVILLLGLRVAQEVSVRGEGSVDLQRPLAWPLKRRLDGAYLNPTAFEGRSAACEAW